MGLSRCLSPVSGPPSGTALGIPEERPESPRSCADRKYDPSLSDRSGLGYRPPGRISILPEGISLRRDVPLLHLVALAWHRGSSSANFVPNEPIFWRPVMSRRTRPQRSHRERISMHSRRFSPTLLVLALLWMPVGCDDEEVVESGWEEDPYASSAAGSTSGRPAPGQAENSSLGPPSASVVAIDIPESVERSNWSFEIDGNAVTRKVANAQLVVSGYYKVQLSEANLPRSSATPTFQWVEAGAARSWPQKVSLDVPSDERSYLVAWLDLDESGSLSVGDRVSRPLEPLTSESVSPVAVRIDRIFVDPSATALRQSTTATRATSGPGGGPPSDGGPGARDEGDRTGLGRWGCAGSSSGTTGLLFEVGGAQTEREVRVTLDPSLGASEGRKAPRGRMILYGFAPEQMDEHGMPREDSQPTFVWVNPEKTKRWPAKANVPIPDESTMMVFVALDLDSNGRLSPGDNYGSPVPLSELLQEDGSIELGLGKALGNSGLGKERKLVVELGAPETPWGTSGDLVPSPGKLLIYGYMEGMINEQGMLEPGAEPIFFWANQATTNSWPLEVLLAMPEEEELYLLAVFDADGDSRLGVGDYLGPSIQLKDAVGRGGTVRLSIDRVLEAQNMEPPEASYGPPGAGSRSP